MLTKIIRYTTMLGCCFSLHFLAATPIEIYTLDPLSNEINHLDADALVVFDVDHTLIMPHDMIFHPKAEPYFNQLLSTASHSLGQKKTEHLASICMLNMQTYLIDENILPLIQSLKDKQIKAIALTAMEMGKKGLIDSLEDWRYNQLKEKGIDFSNAFPDFERQTFKYGILFSHKRPKGVVLAEFLNSLQLRPSKVIFIDDRLDFAQSVENEMRALGIEIQAFHYRASENIPFQFDKDLIKFQILYLIQFEEWLSDKEVKELIQ